MTREKERRRLIPPLIVVSFLAIALSSKLSGALAQSIPHGQDRPPNPARTPAEAIKAMTVPPGFSVEVVAAEPNIVNPVAMTFDERGRIWITESLEYPRREPGPGRDRVKVLEDTDGDGRADKFTIFADGLNIPSGIAVGHGGVWVGNAPDILFLKDTDGDGRADTREVIATGFGRSDTHELPNAFTWGPDGWLYGWNGVFNPSVVKSKNGKTYQFTCAMFRIHPRTRVFEVWCEGTSNPWGIAIDPVGSFFSSACVIDHLWHLVETGYYIRQGGPYPPYTLPIESIVEHKHQKAAYCGIHYFDSPAYPAEYRNRLYMGNIHGNCINSDVLKFHGSTYQAEPAADFLTANDAWFMPVSQKTGPDGCLYILDWYDQYHCYQDANRDPDGIDRKKGRLYRVRYNNTPRRPMFDLSKSPDESLIDLLASENVYDRDTAQRLLTERASPALNAQLEPVVLDEKAPLRQRMHALWALVAAGPLNPAFHVRLMSLEEPYFLAWGVRAAGNQARVDARVKDKVLSLLENSTPPVFLQLAIAARKLEGVDPLPVLIEVLLESNDPLIPPIVWQNLHPLLETRQRDLVKLLAEPTCPVREGFRYLGPRAIERILDCKNFEPELVQALMLRSFADGSTRELLDNLASRLRRDQLPAAAAEVARKEVAKVLETSRGNVEPALVREYQIFLAHFGHPDSLKETWTVARKPFEGADLEPRGEFEELRIRAIQAILYRKLKGSIHPLVQSVLAENDRQSSVDFRGELLDELNAVDDPALGPIVARAFPKVADELKPRVVVLLTQRPVWFNDLLDAIDAKLIPASALNIDQVRRLQASRDPEVTRRVKRLFGTIRPGRNPQRERIVDKMKDLILDTPGDPFAGQAVFAKLCGQCHKIHGEGQEIGPDLTSNGRNSFDQLVSNVFDPNLVIGLGFTATTVATTDGRVLTGLIAENGKDRLVLKIQGGKFETIPRDQVEESKTSDVSLMPEEIEKQLTQQEIADLFAFLCLDKPPTDPTAKSLNGAGPIERRPKK
jgi:putative heme-binding domain-containing protein